MNTSRLTPFLLTHQVNGFLFELGAKLSPVSIRDMMLRGFLFADHALSAGLIGADKELLVIGAGATGATVAMIAAQRGVPTTLIDLEDEPFSRQLPSHTRYLHPAQYDWPAEHWTESGFPWKGVMMPLDWEAGSAGDIAARWRLMLLNVAMGSSLNLLTGWGLDAPDRLMDAHIGSDDKVEVYFKHREGVRDGPHRFAVVVSCIGPGKERCYAEARAYTGLRFWDEDNFSAPRLGFPPGVMPRVLISGGGDGALQDFLRLATTYTSAGEMFAALPPEVQREVAEKVRTEEDQAQRSYLWSLSRYDCRTNQILNITYRTVVKRLLDQHMAAVDAALKGRLRVLNGELQLKLIHPCYHFSNCYALNRILVLLVDEYLRRTHPSVDLIDSLTKIVSVKAVDAHNCAQQHDESLTKAERDDARWRCQQSAHRVVLGWEAMCKHTFDESEKQSVKPYEVKDPYDLIIIRHGIEPAKYLFGAGPKSNHRHILPYYLDLDWD